MLIFQSSTTFVVVGESVGQIAVGTVNTAEFFLTTAASATFISQLGLEAFSIATFGLLIGGIVAAPLAAFVARHVQPQRLMLMVGIVLTATSLFSLYKALA